MSQHPLRLLSSLIVATAYCSLAPGAAAASPQGSLAPEYETPAAIVVAQADEGNIDNGAVNDIDDGAVNDIDDGDVGGGNN